MSTYKQKFIDLAEEHDLEVIISKGMLDRRRLKEVEVLCSEGVAFGHGYRISLVIPFKGGDKSDQWREAYQILSGEVEDIAESKIEE